MPLLLGGGMQGGESLRQCSDQRHTGRRNSHGVLPAGLKARISTWFHAGLPSAMLSSLAGADLEGFLYPSWLLKEQ